jgi:Ni2+-binding GTPase involved in maturation of urease and hydrogenase
VPLLLANINQMRPGAVIFCLSAKTGEGFAPWIEYLRSRSQEKQADC